MQIIPALLYLLKMARGEGVEKHMVHSIPASGSLWS